jgi:hypothetical protein
MSDGKKFIKTNAGLTPEQRLEVVENNFSVILQKIQAYDQVLAEFANINSDLNVNKQSIERLEALLNHKQNLNKESIDAINAKINELKKNQELLTPILNDHSVLIQTTKENSDYLYEMINKKSQSNEQEIVSLKAQDVMISLSSDKLSQELSILRKSTSTAIACVASLDNDHKSFKNNAQEIISSLQSKIESLLSSFQELPQFNEWATKIYIKVCNEIAEKQKDFYYQLDKKCQELKNQLATDSYTAESIKKILKDEMEELSMDGKNAYIKASNASQQLQLLDKKVENINLILKKYELSK